MMFPMFQQGAFQIDADMTPEELQRKREALSRAAPRYGSARYVGEGLGHLGMGIAQGLAERRFGKIEREGRQGADDLFSRIVGGARGTGYTPFNPPSSARAQPKTEAEAVAGDAMAAIGRRDMIPYRNAIASIESAGSGDYSAIGPTHPKMGRALGRYQIMESNIPNWSREVLGKEVTPEEFMANPQIQDAIFDGKFGGYVDQFGPEGAAQAWFAGPGGVGKVNRQDSLGTSVAEYTDKFSGALNGTPVMSAQGQTQGADLSALYEAMANPWLTPQQRGVVQSMIAQAQQQSDPIRALDMERAQLGLETDRLKLDQLRNGIDPDGDNVRSSEILADGTVVQSTDSGVKVYDAAGRRIEGEKAIEAVRAARDYEVNNQRSIYGARREGTNIAEAETGGAAAAAKSIGGKQGEFVESAFTGADAVAGSINNINTAIAALDAGARSGAIDRYIPNITEASASLQNAMDRMGLDVIGSVTFGALSEGELRLAMETAVPRNLDEPQLRDWLIKKRDAQQKVRVALIEQARFLSDPNNSLKDWADQLGVDDPTATGSTGNMDFQSDTPPPDLSGDDADLWQYATPEEREAMWGSR